MGVWRDAALLFFARRDAWMNRWRVGCLSLMGMLTVFFVSYMVSFTISGRQEDAYLVRDVPPSNLTVDKDGEVLIGNRTRLYVEEYDMDSGQVLEGEEELPVSLLGVGREEFLLKLCDYMLEPDVGERARGLLAVELMEFTSASVTVRKTYSEKGVPKSFCLKEESGLVVIMLEDGKTLYDCTDIPVSALPEAVRIQLSEGMAISGGDELYDFLETFTS